MSIPNIKRLLSIWKGLALNGRWPDSYVQSEDISTFERRSLSEGPEFYARNMSQLRKDFLTSLEVGTFQTTARFARKKDSVLPRFLYCAFADVFADDGIMHCIVNVDAVTCINQLTAAFTKIRGGHTTESEHKVIESFINTERSMAEWKLDEQLSAPSWHMEGRVPIRGMASLEVILDTAHHLVSRVLAGSDPREISPKHGSGVSACSTVKHRRFADPRYVEKIDAIWPMTDYYYASITALCDNLDEYLSAPVYDPCAKVILVPKDARGPRLISCEPRETMWIQQGLMKELYSTMEAHNLTRRKVNFTNQTYNQVAAYVGSLQSDYQRTHAAVHAQGLEALNCSDTSRTISAAISWHSAMQRTAVTLGERGLLPLGPSREAGLASLDLKDASDKLHLDVVKRIFPRNWAEALTACRSAQTELPDGRLVPLSKHAPMGSAVCFPVMALTIWSVLTAIAPSSAAKHILVYGDDIIVPSFMAEDAMRVLELIGFAVNKQKSFHKGPFRESCGEEFFAGCRVTPVYLRQNPDDDAESQMCMFAFCNNLLQSAACSDNGWMIDHLQEWYGKNHKSKDLRGFPVQLLARENRADWLSSAEQSKLAYRSAYITLSGVVYTDDPSRVSVPFGARNTRLNRETQVREFRIRVPAPRYLEYDTGDWSHVLRALVEPVLRGLGSDPITNRVRYVNRWCHLTRVADGTLD